MADFISSIQNIVTLTPTATVGRGGESASISTLIKYATFDSVNFSNEGKSLYDISQIDNSFDALLGTLGGVNSQDIQRLSEQANGLLLEGSLAAKPIDYDAIMENIKQLYAGQTLSQKEQEELVFLTENLQSYIQNLSITQLFSPQNSATLDGLFQERLSDAEKADLGKISQQLQRVLFTATDKEGESYLDTLTSLYGLNTPSKEEEDTLFSLFNKRNTLLSSAILNRNLLSNYAEIL